MCGNREAEEWSEQADRGAGEELTGEVARTEAPGGRTESEEQSLQVTAVVTGGRGFMGLLVAKRKK